MSGKRQNYQLKLDFEADRRSETPGVGSEGTETLAANRATESPAKTDTLMEEVLKRENLKEALKRVKGKCCKLGTESGMIPCCQFLISSVTQLSIRRSDG
jgi:hypothetical protein